MSVENHQTVEVPNGPSNNPAPDHGGVILVMGILSLLFGFFGICCFFTSVFGFAIGIASIVLGRSDLVKINAGTMATHNKALVIAGLITGALGTFVNGLLLLMGVAALVFQVGLIAAGAAGATSP